MQYKPAQGRYKVYLIDEVHMLSKHSFNALLKTLEEPPEYVKFLLATTDPQKLPITVLSRCLQFHLKAIMPEQIEQQLAAILDHEKATYEQPALGVIAKAADGSMRDALSLTDQALAFGAGNIKYAAVLKMLGTIDQSHLHYLLHFIASGNSQKVFEKIQEFVHLGADFAALHQELASLCHQIALMQLQLNANVTDKTTVQLLAERLTPEEVQLFYQIAVQGFKDYAYAPNGKVALEMTVMRLLAFKPANYIDIDESMLVKAQQVETIEAVIPEAPTEQQSLAARSDNLTTNLATQTEPVKPQETSTTATVPESVSQQVAVPLQTENAVPAQTAAIQPVVQQTTAETEVAPQSAAPEQSIAPEQPSTPYQPDYPQPRDQAAYAETEQHVAPENINASEQHVTAAQYEQPTAAPVHEVASDPAAVAQSTSTPLVQSEPASFDLAATTNSRNMLRSHRLKREELKKIEAATEQQTPKVNDRFAAPEVTAPVTPVTEPLKKKVVEPSTVTHAVPVEKTPMPTRAVEAKSNEHLTNQHSNNEHSNNQQAAPNHSTNEQELPPLTSYQEQPHNQNSYDDYTADYSGDNYSGNDYGDGDDSQKNNDYFDDHSDNHAKGADVTTAPTSDHHVQNNYFEDTQSVSTDVNANTAHLNASNSSASQASIAKPSASAQVITEVIPEKAPAAKTVVANHDISTLNQSASSTEVMLVNEPNLQSAEIDIAAYVEDKMTDAWFLAIKAMELVGFEKLLAKSCVMQQKDQAIALKLHKSQAHLLNNQGLCEDLKNKLSHYYGQQYTITIEQGEVAGSYTPMELEQVVYQQYLDNAKTSIKNDPIVQTLVRDYAAKVYENSVVPL